MGITPSPLITCLKDLEATCAPNEKGPGGVARAPFSTEGDVVYSVKA